MGFSSQAGQVLFRSQAAAGVYQADTGAEGVAMKLRSGALSANRDLLVTDPEIGGGRDTVDAYLGAVSWSGDLDFYVRLQALTTLFRSGFGTAAAPTLVGTAGVWDHVITPSDSATLPFLSLEQKVGSGLETFRYWDAVVNTLHLEADANGYFMGTAGLIAARQLAGATPTPSPMWDDSNLIVGTNVALTYGGVTLPAKSFGWDFTNNVEDDDFRLGSFYLGDLTAKSREISGTFTIRHENSAMWRRAVYGAAAATTPGGLSNKQSLVITASTYEVIPGSTPNVVSSITLNHPNIVLEPFNFEPSGDDVIENDVSWRAVRPAVGTPICTVTVRNGAEAIA